MTTPRGIPTMTCDDQPDEYLDLTNNHLPSLADVPLNPNLKSLDLTTNRLRNLEPCLLDLKNVTALFMRQNLIHEVSEVESLSCAPILSHLELRDNQFKSLPDLHSFTSLTYLDFSYNEIHSIAPLSTLKALNLQELYLANNKISTMECISHLTALTLLEFGSNRLRTIQGVDTLTNLQELWLGRNRIIEIANLDSLLNLRKISIQSNRLTSMLGLSSLVALEELYLSHNGIERIEGIENLTNLRILDISSNRITSLEGISTLVNLTDLWANDNQIESLDDVEKYLLPVKSHLSVAYMRGNPCASDTQYRLRMKYILPRLEQLDDSPFM